MAFGQTTPNTVWAAKVGPFATYHTPQWGPGDAAFPNYRPRLPVRGGGSFEGAHIPGPPNTLGPKLYLTASGVAGSLKFNLGDGQFVGLIPDGFFPGWPSEDYSAWSYFDEATIQGACNVIGPGFLDFPNNPNNGMIQTKDGHRRGNFYIECTFNFNTFFAGNMAAGIARSMPELLWWLQDGQFSGSDSNGGAKMQNGNIASGFEVVVAANGAILGSTGQFGTTGTTFGLAISINPPPAVLVPSDLHPISMRCIPCQPLFPGHRTWKAFGG